MLPTEPTPSLRTVVPPYVRPQPCHRSSAATLPAGPVGLRSLEAPDSPRFPKPSPLLRALDLPTVDFVDPNARHRGYPGMAWLPVQGLYRLAGRREPADVVVHPPPVASLEPPGTLVASVATEVGSPGSLDPHGDPAAVVITGADGDMGRAFLEHFAVLEPKPRVTGEAPQRGDEHELTRSRRTPSCRDTPQCHRVWPVSRRGPVAGVGVLEPTICVDLAATDAANTVASALDLCGTRHAVVVHAVGVFKLERERNDDGTKAIDADVWRSNVTTLQNVLPPLIDHAKAVGTAEKPFPVTVVVVGSITDRHETAAWRSCCRAKNALRAYLLRWIGCSPPEVRVSALVLNVSTVNTQRARRRSPHADRTYWLNPVDIVEAITDSWPACGLREMDVYCSNPNRQ